jgi:hypothetical protein
MIDWDKPYGEHFGRLPNKAKYTQDGTDYNVDGYEIDGDGTVVEDQIINDFIQDGGFPQPTGETLVGQREDVSPFSDIKIGPGDYTALKKRIGDEEYAKLSGEEKRAQITAFKADA